MTDRRDGPPDRRLGRPRALGDAEIDLLREWRHADVEPEAMQTALAHLGLAVSVSTIYRNLGRRAGDPAPRQFRCPRCRGGSSTGRCGHCGHLINGYFDAARLDPDALGTV